MELLKYLDYRICLAGVAGMIIVTRMFMTFLSNHMSAIRQIEQRIKLLEEK